MKSLMAKALTVAVLAGGTVAVAAAPSFAASGKPVGATVYGQGVGGSLPAAQNAAILNANAQCASGVAANDGGGTFANYALGGGRYYAIFTSFCTAPSVNG